MGEQSAGKLLRHDMLAAVVASAAVLLVPGGEIVNLNFMLPCFCLGFLCGNRKESIERHRRAFVLLHADFEVKDRAFGLGGHCAPYFFSPVDANNVRHYGANAKLG